MTETERLARLLCQTDDHSHDPDELRGTFFPEKHPRWHDYTWFALRLTAAGLTIVPIEPDDATVDEMARAAAHALFDELGPVWAETNERELFVQDSAPTLRNQVRAAWRAGVGRKEG